MNGGTMGEESKAGKATAEAVARYGRFWAELRPASTGELLTLVRPDLLFRDPFNELRGADRVVALLDHMFVNVTEVRFNVLRQARADDTAFYRWDFACRLRRPAMALDLVGVSEVRFDDAGLVAAHIDHWDAGEQVYERIPILGLLARAARRRLAFPG
jgi:limonene-1,2-epoxide hydrolase